VDLGVLGDKCFIGKDRSWDRSDKRKSERRRDWNGASQDKVPEFGGQAKVFIEETNKPHERPKKGQATAEWPAANASDKLSGRILTDRSNSQIAENPESVSSAQGG